MGTLRPPPAPLCPPSLSAGPLGSPLYVAPEQRALEAGYHCCLGALPRGGVWEVGGHFRLLWLELCLPTAGPGEIGGCIALGGQPSVPGWGSGFPAPSPLGKRPKTPAPLTLRAGDSPEFRGPGSPSSTAMLLEAPMAPASCFEEPPGSSPCSPTLPGRPAPPPRPLPSLPLPAPRGPRSGPSPLDVSSLGRESWLPLSPQCLECARYTVGAP